MKGQNIFLVLGTLALASAAIFATRANNHLGIIKQFYKMLKIYGMELFTLSTYLYTPLQMHWPWDIIQPPGISLCSIEIF